MGKIATKTRKLKIIEREVMKTWIIFSQLDVINSC